jgi:hypothetical protein
MNTAAIKKIEIISKLFRIPEKALDKVESCIESILTESNVVPQQNRSLKGIWKDKGVDKIVDLEREIKQIRKELSDSILKREL